MTDSASHARPADVRLDDLAEPRYAPEVRALMDAAVAMAGPIAFTPEALLGEAARQTGLDDFGDDGFRAPLAALLEATEREGELSPFGRMSFFQLLLQLAKNRLLVEDLVKQHPEILAIEIRAPIVIAGLQRTGTTHLHNLLSADPSLRFLPWWEAVEPVLPAAEAPKPGEPDPRLARTQMALDFQDALMPHFKRMHEMTVDHAHEEIHLLAIDFSTMLFEAIVHLPSYRDFYLRDDQTPHYAYLKRVLQVLTWLRGGKRWVLKSPQHLEQIGPLLRTFPDATVVFTHRDPVSVTASAATMMAYGSRVQRERIDPAAVGRYWADRTERMLRACVRDRELVPPERSMDVLFHDYMNDDLAVLARIYALAEQPLPAASRAAIAAYLEAHPRGRHGRIAYKLADVGLAAEDVRRRMSFYAERFGIEAETTAL